jgi:excisionase family DNA binding protein
MNGNGQQPRGNMMEAAYVRREEILTTRGAMELLKIGRTKLWELTRDSRIPAYRVGSGKRAALRYKRSELLAWLDQNRI